MKQEGRPENIIKPPTGMAEWASDLRARAWAYVFTCFERHMTEKGGPDKTALDSAKGGSRNDSSAKPIIPE